jgi:hypothetical protein
MVLLAIAVTVVSLLLPSRSERERVLAVYGELVEAWREGDHGRVWDLQTQSGRDWLATELRKLKSRDPGHRDWENLASLTGLARADVLAMDAGEYFVAHRRGYAEMFPEYWEWAVPDADTLVFERVIFEEDDRATVLCRSGELVEFSKEDGVWGYGYWWELCMLNWFDRKLAAFLPRAPVDPGSIDLVVEIGPSGLPEEGLPDFRESVRELAALRGGRLSVVLDASPELTLQGLVTVLDQFFLAEVYDVCFASSATGEFRNRVHLRPADHPACRRIIGLR